MAIETKVRRVDPTHPGRNRIEEACRVLAQGGLVAFPTDTLYALGADALEEKAVERAFLAKGRMPSKPMTVLIADLQMAASVVEEISPVAHALANRFWPGPLTLILRARPELPSTLTAGTGRIGVRIPGFPLARLLIQEFGKPLTGTSANRSGGKDPCEADDVLRDLRGRIELILDGGRVPLGLPSTILDLTSEPAVLVREGAVKSSELEVLGIVVSPSSSSSAHSA